VIAHILAVACVLLGVVIIFGPYLSQPASPAILTPGRDLLRVRHQLGLAHRLAARLVGVTRRGLEDEGFSVLADLYVLSRPAARLAAPYVGIIETGQSLLEIEELLERLESVGSRVRRWRPGRGRAREKA
jgi:hypothetical protein